MADKKTEEQELQEIFEDKRSFINDGPGGDGKKYYVDSADVDEVRNADWHYSITYNQALLAGVTTAAQMADILEERNITGPEYEKKRLALIDDLDKATLELSNAVSIEDKKAGATKVETLRNQLFRHNQRAASPLACVCEQISEDSRVEYLTSAMIKDEAGNRVWDSYDDYKTTKRMQLAQRSRYEVMLVLSGLSTDFLNLTPEALARKEIKELEEAASTKATPVSEVKEEHTEKPKKKK